MILFYPKNRKKGPADEKKYDSNKGWITIERDCESKILQHINMEINASMIYLSMGAYFSRDTTNRPGFAKLFFEAASEERHHVMKLVKYLLISGKLTSNIEKLISIQSLKILDWKNGLDALENTLSMEIDVNKSMKNLISTCQDTTNHNHFQFADQFLDEKLNRQKDLADKISSLRGMMHTEGNLAEFIYDKKLMGLDIMHK